MVADDETADLSRAGNASALRGRLLLLAVSGAAVAAKLLPLRGSIVIGRDAECDVRIDHPSVSRRHARIDVADAVTIVDLGSRNGVRVGGERLATNASARVTVGALIEVGAITLVVQKLGDHSDLTPHPPAARSAIAADHDLVCEGAVARLLEVVDRVAPDRLSVLLLGETGVGKDVFAELVHSRSPRASKPFVRLHCAAMSEALVESELFGHERGAFTGAHRAKEGLLETADGGTVFIDEVGELTASAQVKLLRVLEDRRVMRIGATEARQVDVRFVAATNRDLEADVARGTFRRDLYYRLAGLVLIVPPLRERTDEIESLARAFVRRAADERGSPTPDLAPDAVAALRAHTWPGNVRELRNVMSRALVMSDGATVRAKHLLLDGRAEPVAPSFGVAPVEPASRNAGEAQRILDALANAGGNQTDAAKALGISRRTLINRLEEYGLPRPRKR